MHSYVYVCVCACMFIFPYILRENKCSKDNLSFKITQNKLFSMPMADSEISNHS